MGTAFFAILGLLGVSGFIVASSEPEEEVQQGPLDTANTAPSPASETEAPLRDDETGEQEIEFHPQTDEHELPPSYDPDSNLNSYTDNEGTPTVELILSAELVAGMHAQTPIDYTAYAAYVDLDDASVEFAFTPPPAEGEFYLASFTYEEPTETDDMVDKSMHIELLYSPSGTVPNHQELMGLVESDLFVLAYLDLGHALFDTQNDVFVDGQINDQPLLNPAVEALRRFTLTA